MGGKRALRAASTPLFPSPWPPLTFLAVGCCVLRLHAPAGSLDLFFLNALRARRYNVKRFHYFILNLVSSPAGPTESFFAHFLPVLSFRRTVRRISLLPSLTLHDTTNRQPTYTVQSLSCTQEAASRPRIHQQKEDVDNSEEDVGVPIAPPERQQHQCRNQRRKKKICRMAKTKNRRPKSIEARSNQEERGTKDRQHHHEEADAI